MAKKLRKKPKPILPATKTLDGKMYSLAAGPYFNKGKAKIQAKKLNRVYKSVRVMEQERRIKTRAQGSRRVWGIYVN